MSTAETVEGVVEARNDTGIRINGAWANRSRFKPVELPDVGTHVRIAVDPKGFLASIQVLENAAPARQSRETVIARLAVLKAAAAFGASRPDLKSSDVLKIAETWLAWVEQ